MRIRENILVVFYGIGRSTNCIKSNIEKLSIHKKNFNFTYAYAVNNISEITNLRTLEFKKIDKKSISSIKKNINIFFEKDQKKYESIFSEFIKFELNINFRDPYRDNYKTLQNLFCQLSLLSDFFKEKTLHEYDSCLVIRDDVVLLDNLGLFKSFQLISTLKNTIFTTSYHWHKGINDRIILISPENYNIFQNRLNLLKEKLRYNNFFNSETINFEVIKKLKLTVISTPFRIIRVRSQGKKRREIFFLRPLRVKETLRVLFSIFLFLRYYFLK